MPLRENLCRRFQPLVAPFKVYLLLFRQYSEKAKEVDTTEEQGGALRMSRALTSSQFRVERGVQAR